jgi:hypothetical protein
LKIFGKPGNTIGKARRGHYFVLRALYTYTVNNCGIWFCLLFCSQACVCKG